MDISGSSDPSAYILQCASFYFALAVSCWGDNAATWAKTKQTNLKSTLSGDCCREEHGEVGESPKCHVWEKDFRIYKASCLYFQPFWMSYCICCISEVESGEVNSRVAHWSSISIFFFFYRVLWTTAALEVIFNSPFTRKIPGSSLSVFPNW